MDYAVLKTIHLLGIVVWVGGMFFAHVCLRPALATFDAPLRLQVMGATLRRFFLVVAIAATLVVASGVALIGRAALAQWRAGIPFTMAVDWYVMTVVGFVMVGVFVHIRFVLWKRMKRAVDADDWPAGAGALASIRRAVLLNLVLGVCVIVVTRLSGAA